ncbi:putative siroheme synthase [Caenibius tardaugens NBRC 16725]|uniref:precorrin-2 dehydrogenase n=1 Tax=Caenibius tardaugens NBRC 16725 TaxID=1219035 RepID=U2YHN8_9SPHN|nr:bifunctional precorrin-2 dehydrogenase/sirohydrochlorin ferrochelatase [Caenibius tardaugens]AZI37086.1 siroheme synthase [Caenibius tardaugens NBRC 16725]GAD47680.1 putative siroheme synthase [Caenibius tardaugens NBRC 16725]
MKSLPLFHRIAGQRVVVLGEGVAAEAKRRLVVRAGGVPVGEPEAHGAALAFVVLDDERDAKAAVRRLKHFGLLVNVPDRPDLCDFTVPSVLDRDPVLIAIGTGGASAGLAKALRLRLETLVPQRLGDLARALHGARTALRARWPDAGDRRRMLDQALGQGGALDPMQDGAVDAVPAWLEGTAEPDGVEPVEIVLTSDDPEDLTLRQARLLGSADVLLHDRDVPVAILDRARADAQRIALPCDGPDPGGLVIVLRRAGR